MEKRKEESRRGSNITSDFIFTPDLFDAAPNPESSDNDPIDAEIVFILKRGEETEEISEGEKAEIITSPQSSLFYAESGGQRGDKGSMVLAGNKLNIINTYNAGGRKVLEVIVEKGSFKKNDTVVIKLDDEKKTKTVMNHTATHLLQAALMETLGNHVKQSGSFVDETRLRFDFTHMKKLSERELEKVGKLLNDWISDKVGVSKELKSITQAKEEGALSFFGDKYGETVRVVSVGALSKEFCGGDHVDNTSVIDIVKIVSESSVASGVRRIEALTGDSAREWIKTSISEMLDEYNSIAGDLVDKNSVKDLEDVLEMAEGVSNGTVQVDVSILDNFDTVIKPAFMKVKEMAAKSRKKKEKEKARGAFDIYKGANRRIRN